MNRSCFVHIGTMLILAFGMASPSAAQSAGFVHWADEVDKPVDQNFFLLGGRFQDEWIWDTPAVLADHYENNYFLGLGYQRFFYHSDNHYKIGAEVGVGIRAGDATSAELWGGFVLRNDGVTIGDFTVSPAMTVGLSAVTHTIGVETQRANAIGSEVPVLFYFGPEIAISNRNLPDLELITRIQHRSGGYGTIAKIDGSNAATVGLRWKF
jgi:hypothetical protein